MSVVGRLKRGIIVSIMYCGWEELIVHEVYDFLTDDDELIVVVVLLLLQLFFKSLCRFVFFVFFFSGGEGKYETGSFEKKIWRRNAAMNFKNRPDIRHGYVPVYDNPPHGSLNHP